MKKQIAKARKTTVFAEINRIEAALARRVAAWPATQTLTDSETGETFSFHLVEDRKNLLYKGDTPADVQAYYLSKKITLAPKQ